MKRIIGALYVVLLLSFTNCGLLNNSISEEIVVNDFEGLFSHEFKFDINDDQHYVYKYKLCLSGEIDGKLLVDNIYSIEGDVNKCFSGDYYSSFYKLTLNPSEKKIKGELEIKLTLYY